MNSLNPVMPVRKQLADGVTAHHDTSTSEVNERISELLNLVGLPEKTIDRYAHELSGGMKQRVCIAMALMNHPALVIADEATSALDVIVQRLVAQTILDARDKMGTSFIVIGHDIGLMAQLVDRIAVMYLGRIVETGPVIDVLTNPKHPYTELLLASVPEVGKDAPAVQNEGLLVSSVTGGCAFRERCPEAMDVCAAEIPPGEVEAAGASSPVIWIAMAEPLLLLDDVSKVFRNQKSSHVAVHEFNLELAPDVAEIVTIAGESGSSKTTIAEMMLGVIQPTSGRLEYRGRSLAGPEQEAEEDLPTRSAACLPGSVCVVQSVLSSSTRPRCGDQELRSRRRDNADRRDTRGGRSRWARPSSIDSPTNSRGVRGSAS